MSLIKDKKEIETIIECGKRLAGVLNIVESSVKEGVSTEDLNKIAITEIEKLGDSPAFLGYTPEGIRTPYPAALCVSINEEVVHGIPSKKRIIKEGDVVSIDLGLKHDGLFCDHAKTVAVGKVSKEITSLLKDTKRAMMLGIEQARIGNTTGDIGSAIESVAKNGGYGLVKILSGHGVGKKIHDDPYVPNYGKSGQGTKLIEGMVIAIEPMFNLGKGHVRALSDEYTYVTKDKSVSAHFEHTVMITASGPKILTI
jgi:methionyl aminopeptidase